MNLLLGFLPFAAFAVGDHMMPTLAALTLAAGVAAALLLRDLVSRRSIKWLDGGAALIFAGLASYTLLSGTTWSVVAVRLVADGGLFVVVALSLVAGRPFTLQYAKERVAPELWDKPSFMSVNRRLTAIWCAVFGTMTLADVGMLHGVPLSAGVVVTLAALSGGLYFTKKAQR